MLPNVAKPLEWVTEDYSLLASSPIGDWKIEPFADAHPLYGAKSDQWNEDDADYALEATGRLEDLKLLAYLRVNDWVCKLVDPVFLKE